MRQMLTVFAVLVLAGCPKATVGVDSAAVPKDAAGQCASQCNHVGLVLDSVVIMAGQVGCVCRAATPAGPPGATPEARTSLRGAATGGGSAAVLAAYYAWQQQQQQQQSAAHLQATP